MTQNTILSLYVPLVLIAGVFLVWTLALTARSIFLGIVESATMRLFRRVGIVFIGYALFQTAAWHWETGRGVWPSEILMVLGLAVYFGVSILSTYRRMRREGVKFTATGVYRAS